MAGAPQPAAHEVVLLRAGHEVVPPRAAEYAVVARLQEAERAAAERVVGAQAAAVAWVAA